MVATPTDRRLLRRAVGLARRAEAEGNLPIGALVTLGGEVVAEGRNAVWSPRRSALLHAEMQAFAAVPEELWERSRELTVYCTLEPCVMCTGAIFLHHVGRVVFGAADPRAGGSRTFGRLPATFQGEADRVEWVGPALPEECDPLFERALELVADRRRR